MCQGNAEDVVGLTPHPAQVAFGRNGGSRAEAEQQGEDEGGDGRAVRHGAPGARWPVMRWTISSGLMTAEPSKAARVRTRHWARSAFCHAIWAPRFWHWLCQNRGGGGATYSIGHS